MIGPSNVKRNVLKIIAKSVVMIYGIANFSIGFAKESSFDTYLQYQIFIKVLQYNGFDANAPRQEFIF